MQAEGTFDSLRFDAEGLIPAIAQDHLTGQIRMVAWMNREALARTLETGTAHFFSRSRGRLWEKGETSGHRLRVREVIADCDADTLLLLCDAEGPSCHTGRPGCFFRRLTTHGPLRDEALDVVPLLERLEREIDTRRNQDAAASYTKSLLEGGAERIGDKIREEAGELADALIHESDERVVSEAADLVYHLLVGLAARRLPLRKILAELARRFGTSGHAEKAARRR